MSTSKHDDQGIRVYAAAGLSSNNQSEEGIRVYSGDDISIGPHKFREIDQFVNFINKNHYLRHKKINRKKMSVVRSNDNKDLYSMQKINAQDNKYNVDHIFEIQCYSYVIASALHNLNDDNGRALFKKLRERLSNVINSNCNLNVTDKNTNLTKMNAIKVI